MKVKVLLLMLSLLLMNVSSAQAVVKSGIDDQVGVEVTVYNNNLGLIKDTRRIKLKVGEGELRFMDVASFIMPETVYVKNSNNANQFMVLEQNYEYDLMDRNKLLDKYIGKTIKLYKENYYQDTTKMVDATLLSNNNNQPIYEIDNEIYLGYSGFHILPKIPENLIAKPTLTWIYKNRDKRKSELEVTYLTRNLSWKADYILLLDQEDKKGDLSGWVTVDNKSGTLFRDASLKLVAGEVNQVSPQNVYAKTESFRAYDLMEARAPMFQEQGFFEYHIYDLERPTTLKNNQIKQINLLGAEGIDIEKEYLVYGQKTYYNRQYREQQLKQPVNVQIKFQNTKENQLEMPLPKGIVRLYKKDAQDKLQFVGEDNIEHTPKKEEVSLKVGEAFDIVAERKQTGFKQITTRLHESSWEIKLTNRKEEAIVVSVIEPVHGSWEMVRHSHPFTKMDAFTVRFDIPLKPDEELTLSYRIRVGLK